MCNKFETAMNIEQEIRYVITKNCPYSCEYCHAEGMHESKFNKECLTPDDYAFLFEVSKELGIDTVTITGGEPLTKKSFQEILEKLKNKGARIKINTNGYLITKVAKDIWKNIDSVHVSLDSLEKDYYEQLSHVPNSFEKVIEGIKFLSKNTNVKIKLNSVSIAHPKSNSKNLKAFLDFAKEHNAIPRFLELYPQNSKGFIEHEQIIKELFKLNYTEKIQNGPRKITLFNNEDNKVELLYMNCAIAAKYKNSGEYCNKTSDLFLTPTGELKTCRYNTETIDILEKIKARNKEAVSNDILKAFSLIGKDCKIETNQQNEKQRLQIGLKAIEHQLHYYKLPTANLLGMNFIVCKNVWSPKHSSTGFFAKNINVQKGQTVIEMGCGSGALSVIACKKGAKKVYAFDINKEAVKCTTINVKKHKMQNKIEICQSNLFDSAPKIKVDLILFNPPFTNAAEKTKTLLGLAVFDHNHVMLNKFLKHAKQFLKQDGKILIAFSLSSGDIEKFNEITAKNGYVTTIIAERKTKNQHHKIFELKRIKKAIVVSGKINELAINSGLKSVTFPKPHFKWNYSEEEVNAVTEYFAARKPISIYGRDGIYEEFEEKFRKYHNSKYALVTCNGTSALHSAFFGVGIKEGDEVIVPTYTFLATVMPLVQLRAIPVLCDAELETGNIDPESIRKNITKKTKAIVVTHLWGHPVELNKICKIAKENNLALIEDCSHAHGATYHGKKVGTFGDAACFSLQGKKITSGGEGGILITNNQEIYERATLLGHYRNRAEETVKSKFYKQFVKTGYGLKYRAHPLAVVIANVQFSHLDEWIAKRNRNLNYLSKQLESIKGIEPPITKSYVFRGAYYGYKPKFKKDELNNLSKEKYIELLQAEGAQIKKPGSAPLHTLPFFQTTKDGLLGKNILNPNKKVYCNGDLPKSEKYYQEILSVPTFTFEGKEIIDQYVSAFEKIAKHY